VTGGDKEALPIARSFPANKLAFRESADEAIETAQSAQNRILVGCGHTWTDHELLIVDPATQQVCGEGIVGEIWFRGPSVSPGYWRREVETEATFRGFLSGSGEGPYLRTGDLGFLCEGELYVSGRLKDLIVIRGRNHYPQDIEETVASLHEAFRPNSTAALGCIIDASEQLVILQEIDRLSRKLDLDLLRKEIRSAISEQHRLHVYDIVFLRKNSLPKTTSGKIRRNASHERYLSGRLSLWEGASTT
jgi:acyl-CoA synthetase (AMP-forming)/AMP-acid ligase II